jgi:hypothetical protein
MANEKRVPGAVTINENGTMLVDLAQAEKLLAGMSTEMQLEITNIMFEPILENATKMRQALIDIITLSADDMAVEIAKAALPS